MRISLSQIDLAVEHELARLERTTVSSPDGLWSAEIRRRGDELLDRRLEVTVTVEKVSRQLRVEVDFGVPAFPFLSPRIRVVAPDRASAGIHLELPPPPDGQRLPAYSVREAVYAVASFVAAALLSVEPVATRGGR